jgi:hypothetical protein
MKVIMLVQTRFNGLCKVGDLKEVSADVAKRWIKRGIAVVAESIVETVEDIVGQDADDFVETTEDKTPFNEDDGNKEQETDELDDETDTGKTVNEAGEGTSDTDTDTDTDTDRFAGMKAKDLYELCIEQGIECEPKQAKQVYIDLLIK